MEKYSNEAEVQRMADKYGVGKINLSTRRDKKYMVETPDGKKVHFGQIGYEDYTKHRDPERRRLFRLRNAKWASMPKYSAGWLSYHLLW
jgi:hypothetical protein